jgi:uncharacterized membrane protein
MITKGFTYIAFLIFFAAMLVVVRDKTKWKIFDYVPPIVMVYLFFMLFSTINLWDMEATAPAYSAVKNNLLYAMIFVMLLRCDFRKLAKLSGRMIAIFLGSGVSISIAFIIIYPLFKGSLGVESWRGLSALGASWIGGSGNMAAMQDVMAVPEADFGAALIVDTVIYSVWLAFLLILTPFAAKFNKAMKADTSKLEAVAAATSAELETEKKKALDFTSILTLLGLSLLVSALSQTIGPKIAFGDIFTGGTMTVLLVTAIGLVAALSPLGKMAGIEEMSNVYLYVVIGLLASRAGLFDLLAAPMWLLAGILVMVIHVVLMLVFSKLFKWDLTMITTASMASIGGAASAPIVSSAYDPSYAGIGVLMGVLGAAVGNIFGLFIANIMKLFV